MSPLPLTEMTPRRLQMNLPRSSLVAALTWIDPGTPPDSIRLTVLTTSPHRS